MSAFTQALQRADGPGVVAALSEDVVFHSPALVTVADEIKGRDLLGRILGQALQFWGGGVRDVRIYTSEDPKRYVTTFTGTVDGHEIDMAAVCLENDRGEVHDFRLHMRPAPVVQVFIDRMKPHFSEDIPEKYWVLA